MTLTTHNLGFPRIGGDRELKKAQEAYWRGEIDQTQLEQVGRELRRAHWQLQADAGVALSVNEIHDALERSGLGVVPQSRAAVGDASVGTGCSHFDHDKPSAAHGAAARQQRGPHRTSCPLGHGGAPGKADLALRRRAQAPAGHGLDVRGGVHQGQFAPARGQGFAHLDFGQFGHQPVAHLSQWRIGCRRAGRQALQQLHLEHRGHAAALQARLETRFARYGGMLEANR